MVAKDKPIREPHSCPYCDEEIAEAAFPYCEACRIEAFTCPECGDEIPRGKTVCPNCGSDIGKSAGGS